MKRHAHGQRHGLRPSRLAPAPRWQPVLERAVQRHQDGQLDAAVALYQDVLRAAPEQPDALHLLGVVSLQRGQPADAIPLIERAIARRQDSATYHANLGVALQSAGRLAAARAALERAVSLDAQHVDALYNLGVTLQELGEHQIAASRYEQVLALAPDHLAARFNLGNALQALERFDEAAACYREVLAVTPGHVPAYASLGTVLSKAGRPEEALPLFEQAARLAPDDPPTLQNLAEALRLAGRSAEALGVAFRAAERTQGDTSGHSKAVQLLGRILFDLGRYEEATAVVNRLLELDPACVDALDAQAVLALEQLRPDDAIDWLERALAARPDHASSWRHLGIAQSLRGESDAAVAAYSRAIELQPTAGPRLRRAMFVPPIRHSHDEIFVWRSRWLREVTRLQAVGLTLDDPLAQGAHCGQSSHFLAYDGLDVRANQERLAQFYRDACPRLSWVAPHCRPGARRPPAERPGGRIRVGIVSGHLADHSVGKLMRGLIARLDRRRFEVVVFRYGKEDAESGRIAGLADRTVPLAGPLRRIQEQVAGQELDVLFFADIGMEPVTYFLAFARLAPVQCTSWGHPVTTGIPNVDDYLSADALEAPGAEAHYSERLVRLGRLPAYYTRPAVPAQAADRAALGLPADATLYVCPQSLFKLHPEFDAAVGEILRCDPRGRLVLIEGQSRNWTRLLRERLSRTMADRLDRVLFLPRLRADRFFDLLRAGDVMLDPFHFGSGITMYEAFAVGAPIVTWPGAFMRGRIVQGAYWQMGVAGPIAETHADYVDLAVALANDRAWQARLREEILAASGALYEDDAALAEIDAYLTRAVEDAARAPRER